MSFFKVLIKGTRSKLHVHKLWEEDSVNGRLWNIASNEGKVSNPEIKIVCPVLQLNRRALVVTLKADPQRTVLHLSVVS